MYGEVLTDAGATFGDPDPRIPTPTSMEPPPQTPKVSHLAPSWSDQRDHSVETLKALCFLDFSWIPMGT